MRRIFSFSKEEFFYPLEKKEQKKRARFLCTFASDEILTWEGSEIAMKAKNGISGSTSQKKKKTWRRFEIYS